MGIGQWVFRYCVLHTVTVFAKLVGLTIVVQGYLDLDQGLRI